MKTLHLTNSWHETSGGIATFYRALIAEANKRSHEIRLVVPGKSDWVEEVGSFCRIYHVEASPALFNSKYRMIYPPQFLLAGSKLQNILALERPDVVEICDKYTLNYLGGLLRMRLLQGVDFRPVVVGLSCERMDDNFRSYLGDFLLSHKFCSWYMRWIYFPFFDGHIANSEYTAAELRTASQGHLVPRGTWIRPMGVDLSHLSPQRRSSSMRLRLLQNFGASKDSILLLYVGRLVPEKNLGLLFDLIDLLSMSNKHDYRLLVVGDGIERTRWETASTKRNPGRVMFLGHIKDRNVLADLYANADFFVHPNPREPFGIAPMEAMASGLPLIAPNAGGVTSYADADNAWTVDASIASFATAIEQAMNDQLLRHTKVARALEKAQEYRWDKVAASFLDLYAELDGAAKPLRETTLTPDFRSTPATQFQRFMFHNVSQAAQKIFVFATRWRTKPNIRMRPQDAKSTGGIGC
jgi:alpha-1,6-mannosyltransferase